MRSYPEDKYDLEECNKLQAEPWKIELLRLNPSYTSWGPHEDYMWKKGDGWDSPIIVEDWKKFDIGLDEYNEVVNFYFSVERSSEDCIHCERSGFNKETRKIEQSFYSHNYGSYTSSVDINTPNGIVQIPNGWNKSITQDEVEALVKAGRLWDNVKTKARYDENEGRWYTFDDGDKVFVDPPEMPTAKVVNEVESTGMGHDAINRWILVETRAKRLGVWGECEHCSGQGYKHTEPKARLVLTLWLLHPRKGCSRGVKVKNIEKKDVKKVLEYLTQARKRNDDRFSKISSILHNEEGEDFVVMT